MRWPWNATRFCSGSASIGRQTVSARCADGVPRPSPEADRPPVYSSRMTAYCRASSGSPASASSTRRASRALRVPVAWKRQQHLDVAGLAIQHFSCSLPSWPTSLYAGCLQQLGQFLARMKQARLHGVLRNTHDLGYFLHGFLVVVDEIDDLSRCSGESAVRHLRNASPVSFFCATHFRIVGRILDRVRGLVVQSNVLAAPERRQGLEPRNRQRARW